MSTLTKAVEEITELIQQLYLSDGIPWVVGYSGGKDSSAALQLVWNALKQLPDKSEATKPVHVISTDTLVESPIVASWVSLSLERMRRQAAEDALPIQVHKLTPRKDNTFWVNLIGRGYPAPRNTFRWCTSRLKIDPSNSFIREMVAKHGEAILVLGTRKAESTKRAQTMKKYEGKRARDHLSPTSTLPNSLVLSPIEDWSNDEVWMYLMQVKNPWGHSNKDLLTMYRGASVDGECPLVVDTSTPSCGNSRFGCWVCTLVEEDKSMSAMIQNDEEKAWLTPLLNLRNELGDFENERERRDFRRMTGKLLIHRDRLVHGPYTKEWREHWLRLLLETEHAIKQNAPDEFTEIELITRDELAEIRRIWLEEKHEFDDSLPRIYQDITGQAFVTPDEDSVGPFGHREWEVLKEICGEDHVLFELQTGLLDIAQRTKSLSLRKNVLEELEGQIRRCYFSGENEAEHLAKKRTQRREEIRQEARR